MNFIVILKALRLEANLSQNELAKRLYLSQAAVAKWEMRKTEPTATALIKLSEFFNVSVDYLLGVEDDFGNKSK